MKVNKLLAEFLKWRIRHLSDKRFLIMLSVVIGIVIGLVASLLKFMINGIEKVIREGVLDNYFSFVYFLLPIIGIFLVILWIRFFCNNRLTQGVPFVLYSIGKRKGNIKPVHMYGHVVASALTVAFGGSVGLEGPSVVTGSAIGSNFAQGFRLTPKQKNLLIGCGSAAAISALFNSPIAAVIFVLEIILVEIKVAYVMLLLFSSASGLIVSWLVSGQHNILPNIDLVAFSVGDLPFYVLLGLVSGLISIHFIRVWDFMYSKFEVLKGKPWKKLFIGGSILGVLLILFPPLYGEGYYTLTQLMEGNEVKVMGSALFNQLPFITSIERDSWFIVIFILLIVYLKAFATGFTKMAGGNGGVFAPSMFIGGTLGFGVARALNILADSFKWDWMQVPEQNFMMVGMSGVAAGLMHAPLTAIFLIAEITGGYGLYIPLMIVVGLAYGTSVKFSKFSFFTKRLAEEGDFVAHDKDHNILTEISIHKVIERDLQTVKVDGTLKDLIHAISVSKRNIFPVVDKDYYLKGIILLDDVRHLIFNEEEHETELELIMHSAPAVVDYHEDMESVMEKFDSTGAWNLPVICRGKYYGFLSKSKIFNVYRDQLSAADEQLY